MTSPSESSKSLHPLLQMLLATFPDKLAERDDGSLVITDRSWFTAAQGASPDLLGVTSVGSEPQSRPDDDGPDDAPPAGFQVYQRTDRRPTPAQVAVPLEAVVPDDEDDEPSYDEDFLELDDDDEHVVHVGQAPEEEQDPWYEPEPKPTCRVCHEAEVEHETHICAGCRELERLAAIAARNPAAMAPVAPTPATAPIKKAEPAWAPPAAETPAEVSPERSEEADEADEEELDEEEQAREREGNPRLTLNDRIEDDPIVLIPEEGHAIARLFSAGMPVGVPITVHQNVLDLYNTDIPTAVSCLRNPYAVELDTTFKARDFPVLRFKRGDLYIVVGFRDRQRPAILGIYVQKSGEGQSGHGDDYRGGGGGSRKASGKPTSYAQLRKRLHELNVEVKEIDPKTGTSEVIYEGQNLGKVRLEGAQEGTRTGKIAIASDYDRVYRKVDAIKRRATAQAGTRVG